MSKIAKVFVSTGIFYIDIPEAEFRMLCGCPADSVKHLMKRGLIVPVERDGVVYEEGPNAILLSDVMVQSGALSNMGEFPVLQMLYRQGMLLPGHPRNTGAKPLLIGSRNQVEAQLNYIFRGNYGLISEQEMTETGFPADAASDLMREKLYFAFGRIMEPTELLDTMIIENEPVTTSAGVSIHRLGLNWYEISYQGESVDVDLNLTAGAEYQSPYPLGVFNTPREYFAVLHSGTGDGWDINRPSMSSIIMFQGRPYMIDAGPNVGGSLDALGISVNEVEGIFHTHGHDDHFAGLVTLLRTDHRIKYYATPLVRASVLKKLAALLQVPEETFDHYFEFHDLVLDEWNEVDGLEVRPIMSPHPVETTILEFRALGPDGYETYAHLADIASFSVLDDMVTGDETAPGLSAERRDAVKDAYLAPATLKKLDIGGGMIHGDAEDFKADESLKIVLSHTALPLTDRQKEIGSGAPYGTVDALIPSHQNYIRRTAHGLLSDYLVGVPQDKLNILLNNDVVTFNPHSLILREGETTPDLYLVLTGTVDMISTEAGFSSNVSKGALIGDSCVLRNMPSGETYRARSFVSCLRLPGVEYLEFVSRNRLLVELGRLNERKAFLRRVDLLSEALSGSVQDRIARAMRPTQFREGDPIPVAEGGDLLVVRDGAVTWRGLRSYESTEYFGDGLAMFGDPEDTGYAAEVDCSLYQVPLDVIGDVPIIRWKLYESFRRRRLSM